MPVRTTALLMMIGLAGTFVIRTANSIWPALYDSPLPVRFVALLLLVASLFTLSFFWSVHSAWAGSGRARLEAASRLATVGAALAVLLRLRGLLRLLREARELAPTAMEDLTAFMELVSASALLWFFYVVHAEIGRRLSGTEGAVAGAAIFAFAAMVTLLLHVLPAPPQWLAERTWPLVLLSITLGLLAVLGLLRFLASVRRHPEALVEPSLP